MVALACHELGHALATKHAGREVPAAGFLIYFGIPSVFVDTTDVWMAGRRARMLVTAAGPVTGLVLAGSMQLVGLAVPALGPLVFKLAFAWYLNVLFNLNPFLALDGYYLLMDWLEIPNLRDRGLAWVSGRLRGRPPRWSGLDREGRIIALYGMLAVLWLAVAANLVYRIWADRVSGLATGLWHSGVRAPSCCSLVIVLALFAPLVYLAAGWLRRRWRRSRAEAAERERETDLPRRLDALRTSDLGGLPAPALAALAARARWLHPSTGQQLVIAGGSQNAVYVVVDGALEARRPGDPGGMIRHHVGPGGVVGLANALTGRSTTLDWHTAGTTLLSVPTATVATVVGPMPGPPPADRAEAEALFADTPALSGLAADERLALIASSHPVDLEPGAPVILPGPTHAVVVESGVIAMPDGVELRRGTLVGPVGDGSPGMVAQTRTPVRLWVIPDASDLPPLVGAAHRAPGAGPAVPGRTAPSSGVHPTGVYPPLAVPPGPPDGTEDPDVDRRFERRMWWLVLLLLLLALLLTAVNFRPGPAWAEMPTDRALLTVDDGLVYAQIDRRAGRDRRGRAPVRRRGHPDRGSAAFGRAADLPGRVRPRCSAAEPTSRSGGCGPTGRRERVPSGALVVDNGRVLADTTSMSGAYRPLALVVSRPLGDVTNTGAAWYSADPAAVTVSSGRVAVGGAPATPTGSAADLRRRHRGRAAAGRSERDAERRGALRPAVRDPPVGHRVHVPPTTDAPVVPTTDAGPGRRRRAGRPAGHHHPPPATTTRPPTPSPPPTSRVDPAAAVEPARLASRRPRRRRRPTRRRRSPIVERELTRCSAGSVPRRRGRPAGSAAGASARITRASGRTCCRSAGPGSGSAPRRWWSRTRCSAAPAARARSRWRCPNWTELPMP